MRAALLQMTASDDPVENAATLRMAVMEAKAAGADMLLTPEVSNCVSGSRTHQMAVLAPEATDATLAAVRDAAAQAGIWVLLGSLAVKTGDDDGRFANRSFLIDDTGQVTARYDKAHMFDVTLSETESYRESDGYRPGAVAVTADTPWAKLGLSICYDLRFAYLYRGLAQAGAEILTVPSAFAVPTGQAHWHVLLRARAIETGCFVLAPAQVGQHKAQRGPARTTYGHSLVVSPWGEVLADAGDAGGAADDGDRGPSQSQGLTLVDLDLAQVARARQRVPALTHDRALTGL